MELLIKKIDADARIPTYAHKGDAGMDLYTLKDVKVQSKQRVFISIGIAMEIPIGYVGLIWDKSGLASKYGLIVLAGVIDSGYRGELKIPIFNTSDEDYIFTRGDKIAQMLIQPVISPKLVESVVLNDTSRGGYGFGSTGKS